MEKQTDNANAKTDKTPRPDQKDQYQEPLVIKHEPLRDVSGQKSGEKYFELDVPS